MGDLSLVKVKKFKFMEVNCVNKGFCKDVSETCNLDCDKYHKLDLGEFIANVYGFVDYASDFVDYCAIVCVDGEKTKEISCPYLEDYNVSFKEFISCFTERYLKYIKYLKLRISKLNEVIKQNAPI